MTTVSVMWFRRDLRLADNAALASAVTRADSVVCVCSCETPNYCPPPGAASRAYRSLSLAALDADLRRRNGGLLALRGSLPGSLVEIARRYSAESVHCTRVWTPGGLAEEAAAREALAGAGIPLIVSEGSLLVAPEALCTAAGSPYSVFTPYYRAWEHEWHSTGPSAEAPQRVPAPGDVPAFTPPPAPDDAPDVQSHWTPGEHAAMQQLERFVDEALTGYEEARDVPAAHGTSGLSAALSFGEITTRQIAAILLREDVPSESKRVFLRQLGWRAYSYHVLHHAPTLAEEPWRTEFAQMPWRDDETMFVAWTAGMTGFPMVDAGMRELLETGWMHNRARLVTGSFLAKDLLIPWQKGEAWFWERLVDADIALNAFNWQWVSGSGADAAPYFRIFNPTRQGERFDPEGEYVRRWVPELGELSSRWIHHPWNAPTDELRAAGVELGTTYPHPIVDHAEARKRALAAYQHVRSVRVGGV